MSLYEKLQGINKLCFYQAEILRLEQKASSYSAENEALHIRLKQNLQGTATMGSAAVDNAVLKGLTEKLERMTAQYNDAMQEVEKVKKVSDQCVCN